MNMQIDTRRFSYPSSTKGKQIAKFVLRKLTEEWDLGPDSKQEDHRVTSVSPAHIMEWYRQSGWTTLQFSPILERFKNSGLIDEFSFDERGEYYEDEDLGLGTNTWLHLKYSKEFGNLYNSYMFRLEEDSSVKDRRTSHSTGPIPLVVVGRSLRINGVDTLSLTPSQAILLVELLKKPSDTDSNRIQFEPIPTSDLIKRMKTTGAFRAHLNRLRKLANDYGESSIFEIISVDFGDKKRPAYQLIADMTPFI